jgi:hypothetical protein
VEVEAKRGSRSKAWAHVHKTFFKTVNKRVGWYEGVILISLKVEAKCASRGKAWKETKSGRQVTKHRTFYTPTKRNGTKPRRGSSSSGSRN